MTDLEKAREWAESVGNIEGLMPGTRATVEVIQSLPDQWVDVEEVRKVTDRHNDLIVDFLDQIEGDIHTDTWEAIRDFMCELNVEVDTLAIPKLPTLADLIEQGHAVDDYLFTWVDTEDGLQLVTMTGDFDDRTIYTTDNRGYRLGKSWEEVTPRPDLPKLKWPGGVVDCEIVEEPETADSSSIHTPMQPSEVPPNEPWLIEVDGQKAIGARYQGDAVAPWSVASLDGLFAGDYGDNGITLIHKLVPEPPALPEGMRLADHEEYGRVVVSPKDDLDSDYRVFCSQDHTEYGADWWYAHKSELTFLDGDQHV